MAVEPTYPGVYIEEEPEGPHAITGVATSIAGFVGALSQGPRDSPVQCLSFADFERVFGGLDNPGETGLQVLQFFLNGGSEAWVSRLDASAAAGFVPSGADLAGDAAARTGLYALDGVSGVNLICAPDMRLMAAPDYSTAAAALLNYALERRAFALIDIPDGVATPAAADWITALRGDLGPVAINGAAYFPQLLAPDPVSARPRAIGASGTMAGLYARIDREAGVWKAPAGYAAGLNGVSGLEYVMTDAENELFGSLGINALRRLPGFDAVAWGARTLAADRFYTGDWTHIPVRRLALHIEESLSQGLGWVAFEANGEPLWARIRSSVSAFLFQLWREGALMGSVPENAGFVRCDASMMTQQDIDAGVVNIAVGYAAVRPAEFVVLSLRQLAGLCRDCE